MNSKTRLLILAIIVSFAPLHEAWGERLSARRDSHLPARRDIYTQPAAPLPGLAMPSKQVTMACPLEGILMEVRVHEGQDVEEGEILARMDNRVAVAAVQVAKETAEQTARIQHAREELAFSEGLFQRMQELKSAEAGSDLELLDARTRYQKAIATLQAAHEDQRLAKQRLRLEQARLEALDIRAPFSGLVLRIHVQPGATLTRDDPLLTVIQLDELEVELHLPLELYQRLETDRVHALRAGPPLNRRLQGRLTFIAPVVDAATRTFRTVFVVDNRDRRLPAGFSVQLDMSSFSPLGQTAPSK